MPRATRSIASRFTNGLSIEEWDINTPAMAPPRIRLVSYSEHVDHTRASFATHVRQGSILLSRYPSCYARVGAIDLCSPTRSCRQRQQARTMGSDYYPRQNSVASLESISSKRRWLLSAYPRTTVAHWNRASGQLFACCAPRGRPRPLRTTARERLCGHRGTPWESGSGRAPLGSRQVVLGARLWSNRGGG